MQSELHVRSNLPSRRRVVSLAVLLVFVDAFCLNQGGIAGITGIVLLVRLRRIFREKVAAVRRNRLRNWAIYMTAVVLVIVLNITNNKIAHRRANALVSAVKAYHSKYQRYPGSLNELVPEFAQRIPRAKYTLLFSFFWYGTDEGNAILFYVAVPPFGRRTYSFARDQWIYLD